MIYLFKGCGKCCEDLVQEGDEWRCFQCGCVYYPQTLTMERQPAEADFERSDTVGVTGVDRKRPVVRRTARHLNPVLAATRFNEEQWWAKNETVIYHLDQGKKVR